MSRIFDEIARAYPRLADEICRLPENQRSDSSALRELGSLVVDLFEAGRTQELQPAFDLAELLITAGPEAEKEAAVVEFLETVQNVASHRACGSVVFEQFLGPASSAAWAELVEVWRGKTSLAEVVASETGASLRRPWWQFWRRPRRRTPRQLLDQVENPELKKIIEQITRE